MLQSQKILFDEISKLPLEKISKVISFVRFLKQEDNEEQLFLDELEEIEFHKILNNKNFINSKEMFAKIEELPND